MILDLFSHKIHSSGDEWPDKLVELAAIFKRFDGELYDRSAIEKELKKISKRASYAARDASKFRDEISAYPAYLGLYHLFPSKKGWLVRLSKTARRLLLKEEPDVASFMRLQLTLFQYPNGMGVAYKPFTNNIRIQANARNRTLDFISKGVHLSPLRLIIKALHADSILRSVDFIDAIVTFEEIFALANDERTNKNACPPVEKVIEVMQEYRLGSIPKPFGFERRFHILKHTDLFELGRGHIKFRTPSSQQDRSDLESKIRAIDSVSLQFNGFDSVKSSRDLEEIIVAGKWGEYFDGITNLSADTVQELTSDIIENPEFIPVAEHAKIDMPTVYDLTERKNYAINKSLLGRQKELADPELTKIKRQKRNLAHKLLIDQMSSILSKLGATPRDNPHIDLYADIPNDGSFLFEMKSGGENILDQIRKGISQLYEYKYRYRKNINNDAKLCLVVNEDPKNIPWIYEYVCIDRGICLCWFENGKELKYPPECKNQMEVITALDEI